MYDDVSFLVCDVVVGGGKVECSVKEVLADRRVEFYNVKANKIVLLFVIDGLKPLDHGCRVFPLIEIGCSRDFAVDSVEDLFAYFAYFGFSWVD